MKEVIVFEKIECTDMKVKLTEEVKSEKEEKMPVDFVIIKKPKITGDTMSSEEASLKDDALASSIDTEEEVLSDVKSADDTERKGIKRRQQILNGPSEAYNPYRIPFHIFKKHKFLVERKPRSNLTRTSLKRRKKGRLY